LALWKAGESVVGLTASVFHAFFIMLADLVRYGTITSDVAGPVGVYAVVGQAASMGLPYVLQFMALLSINLAVINFLPFPALDGGRALLLVVEGIRRRPLERKLEAMLHMAGFVFLIFLVLVVTYRDIVKLF
jgi:regulator of sigma E protease